MERMYRSGFARRVHPLNLITADVKRIKANLGKQKSFLAFNAYVTHWSAIAAVTRILRTPC